MKGNGKPLESLVGFLEELKLPAEYRLVPNLRSYDDRGVQIDELDIVISGEDESGGFRWLIECRDRPADGAEGRPWIEQLIGRKCLGKFARVIAVSTTGFSSGARIAADQCGIELREVRSCKPEEFQNWVSRCSMKMTAPRYRLVAVNPTFVAGQSEELLSTAADLVVQDFTTSDGSNDERSRIIQFDPKSSQLRLSVFEAFGKTLPSSLFQGLVPGQESRVRTSCNKLEDGGTAVATQLGPAYLSGIDFLGVLFVEWEYVPLKSAVEYRQVVDGEAISQTAAFEARLVQGIEWRVELHQFAGDPKVVVTLQKTDAAQTSKKKRRSKRRKA